MKKILLTCLFLICWTVTLPLSAKAVNSKTSLTSEIEITIIYDNYLYRKDLKTDWGFACLIKGTDKTILFDTGRKGEILINNIKKLKIKPASVECVVLSHRHYDHIGGLPAFLELNDQVNIFVPQSFAQEIRGMIKGKNTQLTLVSKPGEICSRVYTTGELGTGIIEQSLVVDTRKGLVVITGCSHPGIVKILKKVKNIFKKNIYLVLGGFHLGAKSEDEVRSIIAEIKKLKIKKVGASHCTGVKQIKLFKDAFKENFVTIGVGRTINI